MIENFVDPDDQQADARASLKLIVMNDVLRNGDGHLKNFGLVYDDVNRPRLAPVYDVLTTQLWMPGYTPALAMDKFGRESGRWLDARGREDLARLAGAAVDEVTQLSEDFAALAMQVMTEILDDVASCPQRDSLALAVKVVEKANFLAA